MQTLIIKYLTGSLNAEERERLIQWLGSPQNQRSFKQLVRASQQLDTALRDEDVEVAYRRLLQATETKKTKTVPLPRGWVRYAAAASLALIMGLGYYWMQKDSTTEPTTQPTIVNNQIETGTDKATLTLENGEQIALEQGEIYETENVSSDGEALTYKEKTANDIAYNQLTIPRGGQYQIKLSDGTRVWLNSETQLKYPVAFVPGQTREVELLYGEAYFDVSPSTEHNGAKFKVLQEEQRIEVLGTEFNINAYQDEQNIYTTLVEGSIALEVQNTTNERTILAPGQQADLDTDRNTVSLATVDVYDQVSWKDGVFSFQGKPLGELMKTLERWYDMEVVFANEALKDIQFKGVLGKDQPIEEIMAIINSTSINSYRIEGRTITIE